MAKDTGPNVVAHGGYLTAMQKAVTAKFTLMVYQPPQGNAGWVSIRPADLGGNIYPRGS